MPDLPLCCLNSLIFISTVVPLVALIGSLAAYAESRFGIWRGNFRLLILSTNMVPSITIALALYYYSIQIGMQGSPLFLIMVYTAINVPPFFLIALSGFNAIPREIEEAAMVDGCSTFKVFLKISLPLAALVLAAAMVITMINVWNEFMLALILTTAQTRTAAVFAGSTLGYMEIYWGKVAATGTLLVIPPIIAGATAQKYLVRGFTAGAIKA
jgi:multiple sugar transport system permease protein